MFSLGHVFIEAFKAGVVEERRSERPTSEMEVVAG